MRNLKYDANELLGNRTSLIDLENRLVVARGEGDGWIGNLGLADANYHI